jgi:hypothetical protein
MKTIHVRHAHNTFDGSQGSREAFKFAREKLASPNRGDSIIIFEALEPISREPNQLMRYLVGCCFFLIFSLFNNVSISASNLGNLKFFPSSWSPKSRHATLQELDVHNFVQLQSCDVRCVFKEV